MHIRCLAAVALLAAFAGVAQAQDYRLDSLKIERPWATATPKGAKVGAGYMTITNTGAEPDRLVGISSDVSARMSVHSSVKDGNVVRMRALADGLEIKPGASVELKPGGDHVMFEGLTAPLAAGTRVSGSLVFEKAGTVDVQFDVQPIGSKGPAAPAHAH
jgi:copper(I)-binding protein